ncbi:hypothetical protein A6769_32035 [Nostoc punctiforme NIES-2108]|uniref:Uncharacterized protein n=1 Tax=Nostoc punctiforme NIES-2108 TaxID=1356359 RepID=A0A367R478_NOSPU|nr:hypothetical protein A6769_32035 [Nostoc punctiforme NIES-2108]
MHLIPFWILDFRFWIVKHLLDKFFSFPSVAIIFQIGISKSAEINPTMSRNVNRLKTLTNDKGQMTAPTS